MVTQIQRAADRFIEGVFVELVNIEAGRRTRLEPLLDAVSNRVG